tara:strand:- start:246 stop:635 length:390 start_codon:yes stop_codon:yes gene_type:complete
MGTLKATLILNDTTTFSDVLNFSISDDLTTTAVSQGLTTIGVTNVGANNIIQSSLDGQTRYVFVRNTGTTDGSTGTTATVNVELTGDVIFGKLAAGEFCFLPVGGHSLGVQLQSSSGTVQCEYAFFTKG